MNKENILVIGLGNPGKKYEKTRHNTGFILLDQLQKKWFFSQFKLEKKFNAEISEGFQDDKKIIFAKPQTFMNLSGKSVKKILDFYKMTPEKIIVIHDDLDIALGNLKISINSSSAGHNGVQSIIDEIGTQEFRRIRVGIGEKTSDSQTCRLGAHEFVLGKFSRQEIKKILDIILQIEKNILF
ncbi:MAG: Peptidyl-tRNA hydrolase [Candidatus Moranbacteria bacterium GW2011_GWE2_35_2-]|nr:MAG: Peptidyl-tRNA hydrolase [Candidatus Moranbacteria bacterium GW2011_GWE2_35_2-]KKQ06760.1 MAG: Peptidyl-tRNA hydrolase [Candidatus Moranbacteria bacterium GW2011_GWF1_36_4]KKQ22491.1 MAG: Peptidyl-tRNA hydrolase [Candidatus Moranbacteria bacterium GW2011_GWF2_37_11]KKQ29560.1 MAG: Peptidyl-tRNA hydrolase [Candidatus Moranbacteria bacterium GW2011_GWD1_37_17]KKQ30569.1 MAG: Peptidyl-tRNA hydrolase [Candidatus Moranbacteria bacterium GW2011_GWE1_37_24]KKQ48206.1 MAG: Peptidyl-tRNA hydrola